MSPEQQIFFRQHTRLKTFDYRANRAYFVTIVTGSRECVFGEVVHDNVQLSRRGLVVATCWNEIPTHHPHVDLDAFVVMPNHVHGVLVFAGDVRNHPVAATPASPRAHGATSGSLGAVIGSFKSAVSRQINRLRPGAAYHLWQPNYYEHVIRNDRALDAIRDYIDSNPRRWAEDQENPNGVGGDDFDSFVRSLVDLNQQRGGDAGVAATGGTNA